MADQRERGNEMKIVTSLVARGRRFLHVFEAAGRFTREDTQEQAKVQNRSVTKFS